MNPALLEPCPNPECGSVRVRIAGLRFYEMWGKCEACKIEGPHADDEPEARRLWNRLPRAAGCTTTTLM